MGIPDKLIQLLLTDEHEVKREAVWALSNCTARGVPTQFNTLVYEKRILNALCLMLKDKDVKVLAVTLEAIANILKVGKENPVHGENLYALEFEKIGGMDMLEALQMH